jgi:hypothetical protein
MQSATLGFNSTTLNQLVSKSTYFLMNFKYIVIKISCMSVLFDLIIEIPAMVLDHLLSDTSSDEEETEAGENGSEVAPSDE